MKGLLLPLLLLLLLLLLLPPPLLLPPLPPLLQLPPPMLLPQRRQPPAHLRAEAPQERLVEDPVARVLCAKPNQTKPNTSRSSERVGETRSRGVSRG